MNDEIRTELSKMHDAIIHVGAANDIRWLGFAFMVNYVLLGLILWRVW